MIDLYVEGEGGAQIRPGDNVQYWSPTYKQWITARADRLLYERYRHWAKDHWTYKDHILLQVTPYGNSGRTQSFNSFSKIRKI